MMLAAETILPPSVQSATLRGQKTYKRKGCHWAGIRPPRPPNKSTWRPPNVPFVFDFWNMLTPTLVRIGQDLSEFDRFHEKLRDPKFICKDLDSDSVIQFKEICSPIKITLMQYGIAEVVWLLIWLLLPRYIPKRHKDSKQGLSKVLP